MALILGVVSQFAAGAESPRANEGRAGAPRARLRLFNLAGELTDPFQGTNALATVFVFLATDCPISNRYAPEVQRLYSEFSAKGAVFWLVYPDRSTAAETIQKHLKEYRYSIAALRDPEHSLVKRTGAKVTPEAIVFDRRREIVYRGRIDDRYVALGKERSSPTRHELRQALTALLGGKPVPVSYAPAVGCYIAD